MLFGFFNDDDDDDNDDDDDADTPFSLERLVDVIFRLGFVFDAAIRRLFELDVFEFFLDADAAFITRVLLRTTGLLCLHRR